MTQIMFEKFSVKGFYIQMQAVLSLFASGRTTGIVVESGHDISNTVPVFEGLLLAYMVCYGPMLQASLPNGACIQCYHTHPPCVSTHFLPVHPCTHLQGMPSGTVFSASDWGGVT